MESPGSYGPLQEYFTHSQSLRPTTGVPKPLSNSQHGMEANDLTHTEVQYLLHVYIIIFVVIYNVTHLL